MPLLGAVHKMKPQRLEEEKDLETKGGAGLPSGH